MHVKRACQQLVHEVLEVLITQFLSRVDNSVHVGLHQFSDDIDVVETSRSGRLEHVNHVYDVVVAEEFQQFDFSHDTLSINEVFKGFTHFLNGNLAPTLVIISRTYHTVCAMADLLNILVLRIDVKRSPYKTLDNHEYTYLNTQTSVSSSSRVFPIQRVASPLRELRLILKPLVSSGRFCPPYSNIIIK